MKTIYVAKSIMGALAIAGALGLGACSAETGEQGAENAIGSTAEALSVSGTSYDALSTASGLTQSCVIQDDNGNKYSMTVAGIDGSGTVTSAVRLFDISASSPNQNVAFTGATAITTARKDLRVITNPGNAKECLAIGGRASSLVTGAERVVRLSLSGTPGSLVMAANNDSSGFTAVHSTTVAKCGSNAIIAIGGTGASGEIGSIQVYKGAGNGWATLGTALTGVRAEPMVAPAADGTDTLFLVASGTQAGVPLKTAEALKFSTSSFTCDTVSKGNLGIILGTDTASYTPGDNTKTHGRAGAIAWDNLFTAGTPDVSEFIVAGGDDGSSTYSSSDKIQVRWDTVALNVATPVAGPTLSTAVHHPAVQLLGPSSNVFTAVAVGGANHAGTAQTAVQKYAGSGASFTSGGAGLTARIFPGLALVSASNLVVAGGQSAANAGMTSVQVVSVP